MTRGPNPRLVTTLGAAAGLALLAGCTSTPTPDGPSSSAAQPAATGVVDAAASTLTATLPVQPVGDAPPTDGVVEGLLAPTNRWYSGLAYAELPARAFPAPVAVQVDVGEIGIALPTVVASDALIAAQTGELLMVSVDGSDARPRVAVNDPVYTSLQFSGEEGPLVTATVAEGWPAIGLVADTDVTLRLSAEPTWEDGIGLVDLGGLTYAVTTAEADVEGSTVTLAAGGWLQAFPVPVGSDATAYAEAMTSPLASVTTSWDEGTSGSATTLEYATVDGGPTVMVPSAVVDATSSDSDCAIGEIETIDGPTVACTGNALSWTVDAVAPTLTLDVSTLSSEEQEAVLAAIDEEAGGVPYPSDTYFGSKAMYRDAQLLALSTALDADDAATEIGDRLAAELTQWTEAGGCEVRGSRCFVYDPNWGGVVGYDVAYGSEEFNDHHFHYGYLIYAATVAVEQGIVDEEQVAPVIDALVADIASAGTGEVPTTRAFDPWAGHSWASGTSPFADGNNQESSSEAVLAWTAVAAWAELRGDDVAATRARWMLSAEAHSALALYVRPDTTFAPEYAHQVVGIEWGAKRDWATWFSPEPSAMLGIQLIPMTPTQMSILTPTDDAEDTKVLASVAEAMPAGSASQFTDLITMYSALTGGSSQAAAWDVMRALPEAAIDDGLSRAYALAFIATAD